MKYLLMVCALPPDRFAEVICTSDGFYMAREHGDCGYNAFLGKPNPSPQPATTDRAWRLFRALPREGRRGLVRLARARGVRLRDFLKRSR